MKKYIISVIAGLGLCVAGIAFASGDQFAKPTPRLGGIVVGGELGYGELNTVEPFDDLNNAVGQGSYHGVDFDVNTFTHDFADFVWGVHVGYDYQLAQTGWLSHVLLGIEAGYKDLGESQYKYSGAGGASGIRNEVEYVNRTQHATYDSQAIDQLLTMHVYLWRGWNVFAKAGVAELYTDYTYDEGAGYEAYNHNGTLADVDAYSISESHTSWNLRPEYELGTGYTFIFTPEFHMDIYALYDHISTESAAGSTVDVGIANGAVINVPGANMVMGGVSFGFNPMV